MIVIRRFIGVWFLVLLLVLLTGVLTAAADPMNQPMNQPTNQETVYEGFLDASTEKQDFQVTLNADDSILVTTEATDGDLDTVLTLIDPDGDEVAKNDDRSDESFDSALGYTAREGGTYTVRVTRYPDTDTSGHFTVTITVGDANILSILDSITRVTLSGPELIRDTEHFRIHYTLEGNDATDPHIVNALAISVEEIWRIQIDRMGWSPPPRDGVRGGGNDLYDVYLKDIIDEGGDALGVASPEDMIGDDSATPDVIENGATSYIMLENDFDLDYENLNPQELTSLMRTTMSHEFNHAIQFGYEVDDMDWYYEATSTWIETSVLTKDEDATGYVEYVLDYPELCFGSESDETDGLSVYGSWLFIQALVDRHGIGALQTLWENIATYEGFEALERTLVAYNDTMLSALADYHVQNLVRNYSLAPIFDRTVWLENTIDGMGRWTYTGEGIQELGANYFALNIPPGVYYAGITNDSGRMKLVAVGVRGTEADEILLERGGTIDTTGYDHVYLMVFNPIYDESIARCDYYDYSIDITTGKSTPTPVMRSWDATHFEPLR